MAVTIAQKLSSLFSRSLSTALTIPQQGAALVNIGAAQYNLINGKVVESHASNAATFAVKTLAGGDPSTIDPVMVIFPDSSILTITAALSLTMPDQAMPGAGVPNRFWFAIANDDGTPRLVLRRCNTAGVIAGFDPRGILSAVTPPGSNSCWNYSNATITNKYYRIIAFADYETALPSNSSWTTSPIRIVMVGPSTPLPGTIVQEQERAYDGQNVSNSGSPQPTNVYCYITPQSNINAVRVHYETDTFLHGAVSSEVAIVQMYRNGTPIGRQYHSYAWTTTVVMSDLITETFLDFPFSNAQQLYQLYFWETVNGSNNWYVPWYASFTNLQELMV